MKKYFFLIIFILFSLNLFADDYPNFIWKKITTGTNFEVLFSVIKADNNSYIATGYTKSTFNKKSDVWVVKISDNGTILWQKTYGGEEFDEGRKIVKANDNTYIIVGITNSFGNGDYDFFVLKIDSNGNEIWRKTFGGEFDDKAFSIAKTDDNNYVIVGYTRSFVPDMDLYVVKIDEDGNKIWEKNFGYEQWDSGYDIYVDHHGNIYITGSTMSNNQDDVWFLKLDKDGNIQKDIVYSPGNNGDVGTSIVVANNGSVYIAGYTESKGKGGADVLILKYYDNGTLAWAKTFGGSRNEYSQQLIINSQNNLVWIGYSNSYSSNFQNNILWIMSFDENGNILTDNKFGDIYTCTGTSVVEADTNKYVVTGRYNNNAWIIKLIPGDVCSNAHLELCDNKNDCEKYNGYWYNNSCHFEPENNNKCNFIEVEWVKYLPYDDNSYFDFNNYFDSQGNLYIYGNMHNYNNGITYVKIYRIDKNGNTLQEYIIPIQTQAYNSFYTIFSELNQDYLFLVIADDNQHFIKAYNISKNSSDVTFYKSITFNKTIATWYLRGIDSQNNFALTTPSAEINLYNKNINIVWSKIYQHTINGELQNFRPQRFLYSDATFYYLGGNFRTNNADFFTSVIKIEKLTGNLIWTKFLSQQPSNLINQSLIPKSMIKLDNNNFQIFGITNGGTTVWKQIIDENGNLIGNTDFLNINHSRYKFIKINNSLYIAGLDYNGNQVVKVTLYNAEGNKIWEKDLTNLNLGRIEIGINPKTQNEFYITAQSLDNIHRVVVLKLSCNAPACNYDNIYNCMDEISCTMAGGVWIENEIESYCDRRVLPQLIQNNIQVKNGWNLTGIPVKVVTSIENYGSMVGGAEKIQSIWKWDKNRWQVWSPDDKIKKLISSYGVPIFNIILPGEGLWIKSIDKLNFVFNGTEYKTKDILNNLVSGWNLLCSGENLKVENFQNIFNNVKTVWKWPDSGWEVWSNIPEITDILNAYNIKQIQKFNIGDGFWAQK